MSNTASMLLNRDTSRLVVIDIQTRLANAMAADARERVFKNTGLLLQTAGLLGVPVVATEQYPQGLGPTDEAVASLLPQATPLLSKTCFACSGAEGFLDEVNREGRHQLVLVGMETHVCVLQTAFEAQRAGFSIFVVEDAVCSRDERNRGNALARMGQAGMAIVNSESVAFEWLRDARHEHFKAVSALLK